MAGGALFIRNGTLSSGEDAESYVPNVEFDLSFSGAVDPPVNGGGDSARGRSETTDTATVLPIPSPACFWAIASK